MGNPLFSKLNQVDKATLTASQEPISSRPVTNLQSRIVAAPWEADDPHAGNVWVTGTLTNNAWVGLIAMIGHNINDSATWACGVYDTTNTLADPGFDNASHWTTPSGGGGSWSVGSSKATATNLISGLVLEGKTANSTLLLQGTIVVKFTVSNFSVVSGVPKVRCSIGSSSSNRKIAEYTPNSGDDRTYLVAFNMDISSGNWGGTSDEQYGQTGVVMFDIGTGSASFDIDDVYVYQGKSSNLAASNNQYGGEYADIRTTIEVEGADGLGFFRYDDEEDNSGGANRFPDLMKFNSFEYWDTETMAKTGDDDAFFVIVENVTDAVTIGRLIVSDYFQVSRAPQYGDLKELIIDDSKPERSASGGIQFDELGKKRGLEFTLKHLSEPEGLYIQHLLGTILGQSKDFFVAIDPDDVTDSQTNTLYGRQDKPVKVKPEKVTTGDKQLFTVDWSVKEIL